MKKVLIVTSLLVVLFLSACETREMAPGPVKDEEYVRAMVEIATV